MTRMGAPRWRQRDAIVISRSVMAPMPSASTAHMALRTRPVECDPVARLLSGEGIGADDPLAVEHDQVATAELFEQSPDGRLVQPRSLRKRTRGRGTFVFGAELEQRNTNAVGGGIVTSPAIEHMVGPDHCLQRILDRW